MCHAYLHGGSRGDFRYYTGATAGTCPSSARTFLDSEVDGLIAGRDSNNGERAYISQVEKATTEIALINFGIAINRRYNNLVVEISLAEQPWTSGDQRSRLVLSATCKEQDSNCAGKKYLGMIHAYTTAINNT